MPGSGDYRVGLGTDAHPLSADRPCRLGGVVIPDTPGPIGHSDGDPLLHALADALFGAIGAGDIGQHFPDDDPAHAGADSATFVTAACARVRAAGLRVVNVDAVVTADRPRLEPHRDAIVARLAELCDVARDRVNCKAKSWQGWRGGGAAAPDAILAQVVVLLAPAGSR